MEESKRTYGDRKRRQDRRHGANVRKVHRALGILLAAAMVFQTFPCGFVTVLAEENSEDVQEFNDGDSENSDNGNKEETKEPEEEPTEKPDSGQEECICEERCKEGSINKDCPVCRAEDASLSDCKGKETEENIEDASENIKDAEENAEDAEANTDQPEDTGLCKHHREHDDTCGYLPESEDSEGSPCTYECRICPIEDLIVALPDVTDITEDNAEEVQAQLEEILALFVELTEEEQEQIDLSYCYALQEVLDTAKTPVAAEEIPADAVVKIEKEDTETVYVTEDKLDDAFAENSSYVGATFTLLQDVERTSHLDIQIDCTLDLGGHDIKSIDDNNAIRVVTNVIIEGKGEVFSANRNALGVEGTVTLKGGTFTSNGENCCGVYVNHNNAALSVTGENVVIQSTKGYGLGIGMAQSVQFSAGKYSGAKGAIICSASDYTLGDLLGHTGDTRYAYFDSTGTTPFTGKLEETVLNGTVTVKKCDHTGDDIWQYTQDADELTHTRTCLACGKTETKDCEFEETAMPTADTHTGQCPFCKRNQSGAHSFSDWTGDPVAKTCTVCGYKRIAVAKVEKGGILIGYVGESDFTSALQQSGTDEVTVTLLQSVTVDDSDSILVSGNVMLTSANNDTLTVKSTLQVGDSQSQTHLTFKDITVEIAGYGDAISISGTTDQVTFAEGAKVQKGLDVYWGSLVYASSGEIEIQDGAVLDCKMGTCCIHVYYPGKLNMSGGELIANVLKDDDDPRVGLLIDNLTEDGSISITGGKITAEDGAKAIQTMGKYDDSTGTYGPGHPIRSLLGAGYAYYQNNAPVPVEPDSTELTGTVTVRRCEHVYQYAHTNGTTNHSKTCPACGDTKTSENCSFDESGNCPCGAALAVTLPAGLKLTYDGTPQTPAVTVKVDGITTLTENTDYTAAYDNNTDAGEASVTVTGKGGCTFRLTAAFSIAPAALLENMVTLADDGTYSGKEQKPVVTVTDGKKPLTAADYTVVYIGDFARVGTYTVDVIGKGNYTGTIRKNYEIKKAVPVIIWEPAVQELTYTGSAAEIAPPLVALVNDEVYSGSFQYEYADGSGNYISGLPVDAGAYTVKAGITETDSYTAAETAVPLNLTIKKAQSAPDMPPAIMDSVSNGCRKVGDVSLPEYWEWQDSDREKLLEIGMAVEAVAVYNGPDQDNYETVTVTVSITRSACDHTAGDVLYTGEGEKEPACTEEGIGHTECMKCGTVMEQGIVVPARGHVYDEGRVTKEPTLEAEGERTYTCTRCGHTYTETVPKKNPQGLWIDGMEPSVGYTGSAIKQEDLKVYYGSTPLREGVDYTISYKNNTNAGTAQLIVTGKGNYTGKVTRTFVIRPLDISEDTGVTVVVAIAVETGRKLKPAVTVTWNGKKLREKTDYTLSYHTEIKTAGNYDVTISGVRNYMGAAIRTFQVKPRGTKLLSSAKVTGLKKSYPYQSGGLAADLQGITVKIGKTTLTRDLDYTVRTENTDAVGKGNIVIEAAPTGIYGGEKRIAVTITGTDLRKGSIKGVEKSYPYTGVPVMPQITVYSGRKGSGQIIPADAYTVSYKNNRNKGTATVTATGIPEKGYFGSVKMSYQIGRLDLAFEKAAGNIKVTMPADIRHAKGGAKPVPVITYTYGGTTKTLREGADYTLKYSNNMTAVDYEQGSTKAAGVKLPAVKITGIGNYSGSITENFVISKQGLEVLSITVTDKAYGKNKRGSYYYSAPKVYDLDGKQLGAGRDYTVQYTYAESGQPIGKNDRVEAGTRLCATVTPSAQSSYIGTLRAEYVVREAKEVKDIGKIKNDKIENQQFTGSALTPEVRLYTQTGKTKTYLTDESYEVVGCYNNVKRGTATILVRGKGAYSGVKRITFRIVQKRL